MRFRNLLLFILMVSLWGANWSVMKVGLTFAPPLSFALHRFATAAVFLFPALLLLRRRIPRDSRTIGLLLVYCTIYVLQVLTIQIGLVDESSGISAVLTFTQPIFVFCLATLFLQENVTKVKVLGVISGFSGVVILTMPNVSSFTLGSALVLVLGGFFWATGIVFFKKFLSHVDPSVAVSSQLSLGTVLLGILGLITGSLVLPPQMTYLWITLISAIGSLVVGTIIWIFLLEREDATTLSGSSFIIPVLALIFGWLLLGESTTVDSMAGSGLVLLGIVLVNARSAGH
ncbi:MAG: DMT family transporter [Candidatus Bathyarchaeota archaeon]|nr:MAG: DMT family transporter [Candidatus Bathyarchaeota archaeon]